MQTNAETLSRGVSQRMQVCVRLELSLIFNGQQIPRRIAAIHRPSPTSSLFTMAARTHISVIYIRNATKMKASHATAKKAANRLTTLRRFMTVAGIITAITCFFVLRDMQADADNEEQSVFVNAPTTGFVDRTITVPDLNIHSVLAVF